MQRINELIFQQNIFHMNDNKCHRVEVEQGLNMGRNDRHRINDRSGIKPCGKQNFPNLIHVSEFQKQGSRKKRKAQGNKINDQAVIEGDYNIKHVGENSSEYKKNSEYEQIQKEIQKGV